MFDTGARPALVAIAGPRKEVGIVLVELGVVEQRYDAVKEVRDGGGTVTEVAERYVVTRQSLHGWIRRYRGAGDGRLGRSLQAAEDLPALERPPAPSSA